MLLSVKETKLSRQTFRVFDKDSTSGGSRFAFTSLVDREHSEVVLSVLDEVRYVEDGRRRRHLVHPHPVVRVGVFLLDEVAHDLSAAVRSRLLPRQRYEVVADLFGFRLARCIGLICRHEQVRIKNG